MALDNDESVPLVVNEFDCLGLALWNQALGQGTLASSVLGFEAPASRVTCLEPGHTGSEIVFRGCEKIDLDDFLVIACQAVAHFMEYLSFYTLYTQNKAYLYQTIHPITL